MSRILIALTPVAGRVRPALPLTRALVEGGHEVVVYTGRAFAGSISELGAQAAPMVDGRDVEGTGARTADRSAPRRGIRRLRWEVLNLVVDQVPGYLKDIEGIIAAEPPDVIVMDDAFIAGAIAARVHDTPSVLFTVSPFARSHRDLVPFGQGPHPTAGRVRRALRLALAALVRNVILRKAQHAAQGQVRDAGLEVPAGLFLDWAQTFATKVLHASVPSFEHPRGDLPENAELVGPLLPAEVRHVDAPAWWGDVVAARRLARPVVLVTQGAVATDAQRLVWPAAEGLQFEDVLVVATAPPSAAMPDNMRAERFMPFDRLLPMVDVLVTDGAFGGVQQALAAGVPVVVAGRTEDRAEVGARVERSGVGVVLKARHGSDATSPGAVRAGVLTVLGDPSYRRRAAELADEYARHDGLARTTAVVEELALGHPVP
ncbi:glycosyltransferase [Cellulomonas sp. URHE0023]|uniref:glycosyltransferase n=1 Tax=Cellulomonas sp. URHE0023 TaxID=1380354 RepID=UPI00048746AE|nr:nucleotide disphospho-sugar-binding domain-containing protein [Cellulomonas sp. URHE0023]